MAENQIKLGKINLKGWHAVVGIVVLGLFIGYRFTTLDKVVDEKVLKTIENEIKLDFTRTTLPLLKRAIDSEDQNEVDEESEKILRHRIEIESVSASRSLFSITSYPDAVFRVKYSVVVDDETLDEGVRYMDFENGMISGWRYYRDVSKISYYLNLL